MSDHDSPWKTRTESAEYARVSVGTIDRWAREGDLTRHYPRGTRSVRFHRDELDRLMVPARTTTEKAPEPVKVPA